MVIIASLRVLKKSCNNCPRCCIRPIVVPKTILNITRPKTLDPSRSDDLKAHCSRGTKIWKMSNLEK